MKTKVILALLFSVFLHGQFSIAEMHRPLISLSPTIETIKKPLILARADWDTNTKLRSQYELDLGDMFNFSFYGRNYNRTFSALSYLESENMTEQELKDSLDWWIVLHHTEGPNAGSAVYQAKQVIWWEINKPYYFSDLAYNFFIDSSGQIMEGIPWMFMSKHAGKTGETEEYLNSHGLPEGAASLRNYKGEAYEQKKCEYFEAQKFSPNYLTLGICLSGNFDLVAPTQAQLNAKDSLITWLQKEFHIPADHVIRHGEVIDKIILPQGLTPKSHRKSCPGKYFSQVGHRSYNDRFFILRCEPQ